MTRILENQICVVTGAGRGIGRALSLGFAREGASLVLVARTLPELDSLKKEIQTIGEKCILIPLDLSDPDSPKRVIEQTLSEFGKIDILVNNAAVGSSANPKLVADFDDRFWTYTLSLNLTAPYLLSKYALPAMIAQRYGRILNISSLAGKIGLRCGSAYAASKHGLLGLTRSLAMEVVSDGITVNAICPGPVRSKANDERMKFEAHRTGRSLEELEKQSTPIGRRLNPEEIVPLALLLVCKSSGAITGQAFNVDGGSAMF